MTPVRRQEDPIRAQKSAVVSIDPITHRAGFVGIGFGARYGPDELAICRAERFKGVKSDDGDWSPDHVAPAAGCTCGFYAFGPDHERPEIDKTRWTLDVELAGRVIRHKLGYRAQHQRVMKAAPPSLCVCGAWTRFLVVHTAGEISALCAGCAEDPKWLAVDRAYVEGLLGVELDGWWLRKADELGHAKPAAAPTPTPAPVAVSGGEGLGLLARLISDELPGDLRPQALSGFAGVMSRAGIVSNQNYWLNLPHQDASNQVQFRVNTYDDRIEIAFIVNAYQVWRRTLFYGKGD